MVAVVIALQLRATGGDDVGAVDRQPSPVFITPVAVNRVGPRDAAEQCQERQHEKNAGHRQLGESAQGHDTLPSALSTPGAPLPVRCKLRTGAEGAQPPAAANVVA